jgi:regulatory protein
LDDEKFATWWVEQRLQFRSKSKRELIQELRLKGITKDTMEDVFSKLEIDEEAQAMKLFEKNKYKWERLSGFEKRKKVSAYFARRGFSWDVIRKVIE